MTDRLIARTAAVALAALFSFTTLVALDTLAQPSPANAWAQAVANAGRA
jgi:hypothetical protein